MIYYIFHVWCFKCYLLLDFRIKNYSNNTSNKILSVSNLYYLDKIVLFLLIFKILRLTNILLWFIQIHKTRAFEFLSIWLTGGLMHLKKNISNGPTQFQEIHLQSPPDLTIHIWTGIPIIVPWLGLLYSFNSHSALILFFFCIGVHRFIIPVITSNPHTCLRFIHLIAFQTSLALVLHMDFVFDDEIDNCVCLCSKVNVWKRCWRQI